MLGILCLIAGFAVVLLSPGLSSRLIPSSGSADNPELIATIALPTDTETPLSLPPTWTSVPPQEEQQPIEDGQPTLRPSSTPIPTNTVVVLPTFTATVRPTKIGGGAGVGGGNCTVVYQNPTDGSTLNPGQGFTTRWTLKNTSKETWRSDSVDLKVAGGDRMHTGADMRDLAYDVPIEGMVDILIDMVAPTGKGSYTENWVLARGDARVCAFYVNVNVK